MHLFLSRMAGAPTTACGSASRDVTVSAKARQPGIYAMEKWVVRGPARDVIAKQPPAADERRGDLHEIAPSIDLGIAMSIYGTPRDSHTKRNGAAPTGMLKNDTWPTEH